MESDDTKLLESKTSNKIAPLPDEFPNLQDQVSAPGQPPPYFVIQQQRPTQQVNISWIGESQCSLPRKPVERRSFTCPIVFSIVVLVTCGVVFGLIGLVLALLGRKSAIKGDNTKARRLALASYSVSIVGLILGVTLFIPGCVIGALEYQKCNFPDCEYGSVLDLYHGSNCRICCPTLDPGKCSFGTYLDDFGCHQCCTVHDDYDCVSFGSYLDSMGCKRCCESNCKYLPLTSPMEGYGWYYDSHGCRQCCIGYNNTECSIYGSFLDSFGCKQCCMSYNSYDCQNNGYFFDLNGCKYCCRYFNIALCRGGWGYTSNGCKTCCYSNFESAQCDYERHPSITATTTPESIIISSVHVCSIFGSYDYFGQKQCCTSYDYSDCEAYGSYNDSLGCLKCCNSYKESECAQNSWYRDSNGCKQCCSSYNKSECAQNGWYRIWNGCKQCCSSYKESECAQNGWYSDLKGCKKCCSYYNESECAQNGWHSDSNGCKQCCSSYNKNECAQNGVYRDSNGCKQCCSSYNESECAQNGVYRDWKGCKKCCSYYNESECARNGWQSDSNGCKKCCRAVDVSLCTYGWKYVDWNGCKRCCYDAWHDRLNCRYGSVSLSLNGNSIETTTSRNVRQTTGQSNQTTPQKYWPIH